MTCAVMMTNDKQARRRTARRLFCFTAFFIAGALVTGCAGIPKRDIIHAKAGLELPQDLRARMTEYWHASNDWDWGTIFDMDLELQGPEPTSNPLVHLWQKWRLLRFVRSHGLGIPAYRLEIFECRQVDETKQGKEVQVCAIGIRLDDATREKKIIQRWVHRRRYWYAPRRWYVKSTEWQKLDE